MRRQGECISQAEHACILLAGSIFWESSLCARPRDFLMRLLHYYVFLFVILPAIVAAASLPGYVRIFLRTASEAIQYTSCNYTIASFVSYERYY